MFSARTVDFVKKARGIAFVAMFGVASCVFADEDPYAGYVTLTRSDSSSKPSWNVSGGWSDGLAPHGDANYYVAADRLLYRTTESQTNEIFSTMLKLFSFSSVVSSTQ